MESYLQEIVALTSGATTRPTSTPLPRVEMIKGDVPQHQLAAIYEPMLGFVVQGAKTILIGEQTIHAVAPSYFVIATDVPATGNVQRGRSGQPYLSVGLRLHQESLLSLLRDVPEIAKKDDADTGLTASPASIEFVEAWVRMLRLLRTPEHIPALASGYEREILYWTLIGPQGQRLRRLGMENGWAPRIRRVAQWMRANYTKVIDVENLAEKARMGTTTFHRHFKQITGLSPIQFQKQLRLLEARNLVAYRSRSVSEAAYEVGYESVSQFTREYSRFFGRPPARDAQSLKGNVS
jgi:AraC-like DNA-binding protein